jgi:hypothetical protein
MGSFLKVRDEVLVQRADYRDHLDDGIAAFPGIRAVRGPAQSRHSPADNSLVGRHHVQPGRLSHHGRVCPETRGHEIPHALVPQLLPHGECERDGRTPLPHEQDARQRQEGCGNGRLGIAGPAPVQAVSLDAGAERFHLAVGRGDGVGVGLKENVGAARFSGRRHQDVGTRRLDLGDGGREAQTPNAIGQVEHDLLLARAIAHPRVHAGNPDEIGEQADDFRPVNHLTGHETSRKRLAPASHHQGTKTPRKPLHIGSQSGKVFQERAETSGPLPSTVGESEASFVPWCLGGEIFALRGGVGRRPRSRPRP